MSFFKKLADALTSNESRFDSARSKFLIGRLNSQRQLEITVFPNALNGKSFYLPADFPFSKFSEYSCINIPELIEQIVYFGLFCHNDSIPGFVKENVLRFHSEIKAKDASFSMTAEEMYNSFEKTALVFRGLSDNEHLLPSSSLLFDNSLTYENEGKYDGVFRAFYLLVGHFSCVGMPVFGHCQEEIEAFLKEQESQSFRSFSDYSNDSLMNNIYTKNADLCYIDVEKLKDLYHSVTQVSFESDEFRLEDYIDWLKLVLIYNGATLEKAETEVANLKKKLFGISENWAEIGRIALVVADFENIPWKERFGVLYKMLYAIGKLHYN